MGDAGALVYGSVPILLWLLLLVALQMETANYTYRGQVLALAACRGALGKVLTLCCPVLSVQGAHGSPEKPVPTLGDVIYPFLNSPSPFLLSPSLSSSLLSFSLSPA